MRTELESFLARVTGIKHALRMTVRRVHHEKIDTGVDETLGALKTIVADAGRSRYAQAALRILRCIRVELRLLDVLDGDQADAVAGRVHDQQLLDAALVQQTLGFLRIDGLLHRDQILLGHQFVDPLLRIGREAHIAIGEDADQPAELLPAGAAILDDRDARDAVELHQGACIGERPFGADRDRIHHHARLELLDLADLLGLLSRLEIAVDDADAAGLRHGDGEARFCDRVHRRRQDREVEVDVAGDSGPHIGLAWHDLGMGGLKEHVVEGQCQDASCGFDDFCHGRSF